MSTATPHIDAAREACAAARVHFAERLKMRSQEGITCRVSLALQESSMVAIANEIEAGAATSAVMTALAHGIGDLLSSHILALEASAADGVRPDRALALFNTMVNNIASTFLQNVQRNASLQSTDGFLCRPYKIPPQGSA